ncbi:hypothetical protein V2J09_008582, partial [Rumex salicifolius]
EESRNRITGLHDSGGDCKTSSEDIQKVVLSLYECLLITTPTAKEIKVALFQMHPTKAPGVDGMHDLFYQNFWAVVGPNIVCFIQQWWRG